jgi:hypothetical protein
VAAPTVVTVTTEEWLRRRAVTIPTTPTTDREFCFGSSYNTKVCPKSYGTALVKPRIGIVTAFAKD